VFREVHELPYGVVTADAGDFLPAPGDSYRAEIAAFLLESMPLMQLDVVGVGEIDLNFGPGFLREAARRLPMVGANVRFGPALAESLPAVRWLDAKGRRVAVTAYLDPLLYYEQPGAFDSSDSILVTDPRLALEPVLAAVRGKADIVVLLAHDQHDHLVELVSQLKGVDIVVEGHDPMGSRAESKVGEAFLVQPDSRAREVALFVLSMGPDRTPVQTGLQVYRLITLTTGDPLLEALEKDFKASHGLR
jgi:2',3'-cyclic-nucleotide 2'-phosphodiesterase (5'-nucleotidase family)